MLCEPFDASLSFSAVELSQPRSFSHARAQRTVFCFWGRGEARRLRGPREVTGDDVAWLAIKFSFHPAQSRSQGGNFLRATTTMDTRLLNRQSNTNYQFNPRVF